MKNRTKIILPILVLSLILLAGCTAGGTRDAGISGESVVGKTLPGIPKRPRIPTKNLQASVPELGQKKGKPGKEIFSRDLLEAIDRTIDNPSITEEDLERGWYYGQKHEKKFATPRNWTWVNGGGNSIWMRPDAVLKNPLEEEEAMCRLTAGRYQYSCYDYKHPECRYVGKSKCECPAGTRWLAREGCLLIDDLESFVTLAADELKRGWYAGDETMKKKGTPASWRIKEVKGVKRWQNVPR